MRLRVAGVLVCGLVILAPAAGAADPGAPIALAPPLDPGTPSNPSGQQVDPDSEPGQSEISWGEQFRLWTPISLAEANAADPTFRSWVDQIRMGRATKPLVRLWWYYRTRLQPFDRLVPEGWRARGTEALRDARRTRGAVTAFDVARAASAPAQRGGGPTAAGDAVVSDSSRLRPATAPQASESGFATPGISPHGRWVPIGPYSIPGRTTGLDRPAGDPDTLYASVADGGVWVTRDGAKTWEPLSDFEDTLSGGAILLDPTDPRIIYFGTGEGNGAIDNYGGVGVLKSADGGQTWTRSNAFSGSIRRLAMHRSETTRVYAAGDSGCYVSTDSGATFNLLSGVGLPTNAGASDVVIRPDNPDVVFCAIWGGADGGIYRSANRGASWSLLTNGLPAKGAVGRIALAISKSSPNILLAGIDQGNGKIYKTTDGGDSWAVLAGGSAGYCGGQCWYDNVVGIDSDNPNVMYYGGVGFGRSLDGGATWAASDAGVHVDHHFILTPSAGEVVVANDGGIYRSTNQASSWSNWGLGMDTTQYYGICRHPSDPYWAMGGTQDNGSHRRRATDNPEWKQILGADGGMCMTGPPGGSVVLGEYQNLSINRSTDGGDSFYGANGGIPGSEPHPWVGLLVADPTNRLNMWTSTNRVYRSLDARATVWVAVSSALYYSLSATAIEVSPADSNRVYVGYEMGGLFRADNAVSGPVSWVSIKGSMPNTAVRRLRAHPTILDTVYLVYSGYGAARIWKSIDKGVTWANITGDLPDVPVNDLVVDADNPGTLVVATDLGIFRTDSEGGHWYGWSPGYPTVASIELTFDRVNDKLRVGTHGRSMWEWQEASPNPTAVPDGSAVPGRPLRLDKIGPDTLRVRWDSAACTAWDYNLFYGDLADVSAHAYSGAVCGIGTGGRADFATPSTPSGNVFFVLASTDGAGREGPHAFTAPGVPSSANAAGLCGITQQVVTATCP